MKKLYKILLLLISIILLILYCDSFTIDNTNFMQKVVKPSNFAYKSIDTKILNSYDLNSYDLNSVIIFTKDYIINGSTIHYTNKIKLNVYITYKNGSKLISTTILNNIPKGIILDKFYYKHKIRNKDYEKTINNINTINKY